MSIEVLSFGRTSNLSLWGLMLPRLGPPPSSTWYIDFMEALATCKAYQLDRLCGVFPRPSSAEIAALSCTNVATKSDSIVFGGISIPQPSSLSLYMLDHFSKNRWRPKPGNMEGTKNRRERAIPTIGGKCICYRSLWKHENTGNGRTQRGTEGTDMNRQHEDNMNKLTIIHCQPFQQHKLSLLFNPKEDSKKMGRRGPRKARTWYKPFHAC